MLFIVGEAIAEDSKNKSETIKFAVINEAIPVTNPFVFSFQHFYRSSGPFGLRFRSQVNDTFYSLFIESSRANYKTWQQIKRPLELVYPSFSTSESTT